MTDTGSPPVGRPRTEADEADRALLARVSDGRLEALEELFQQMLRLTLETGTMKLGRVALDGSKVKANASKPVTVPGPSGDSL